MWLTGRGLRLRAWAGPVWEQIPMLDWLVAEIWPENDKVDPRPILKTGCSENMFEAGELWSAIGTS